MYGSEVLLIGKEISDLKMVHLSFLYGSEVLLIGKEISDLKMVHLSFLKNMLGVKQQTTSVTIYGVTGRYPLFLKQQILALKYWIRLISLPKSCYLRIVYNSLASLDFFGETNYDLTSGQYYSEQTTAMFGKITGSKMPIVSSNKLNYV